MLTGIPERRSVWADDAETLDETLKKELWHYQGIPIEVTMYDESMIPVCSRKGMVWSNGGYDVSFDSYSSALPHGVATHAEIEAVAHPNTVVAFVGVRPSLEKFDEEVSLMLAQNNHKTKGCWSAVFITAFIRVDPMRLGDQYLIGDIRLNKKRQVEFLEAGEQRKRSARLLTHLKSFVRDLESSSDGERLEIFGLVAKLDCPFDLLAVTPDPKAR